jgi:putative Holliday junction resolvase
MAFDFGQRRTGVAIGVAITASAKPLTTLHSNAGPNWLEIEKLISEWQPRKLIVGIPDDSDNNRALRKKITQFSRQLAERFNKEVCLHDETLSSHAAYDLLKERRDRNKGKIKKEEIDSFAAALLMESWMNSNLG